MSTPLVSIITPSYNQGEFLGATLSSVAEQTYERIEHIVMDGGSTDESTSVLENFDGPLEWVSERDGGQADAINKGVARSNGEIIAWLNSDDTYVSPSVVEEVVALFAKHPDADVVTGGGVYLDAKGKWISRIPQPGLHKLSSRHMRYRHTLIQPATFVRRELMERFPCDAELHFAFDWDLFAKIFENGNVLPVYSVWAGYRLHGDNKTLAGGSRRAHEMAEVTGRSLGYSSAQHVVLKTFASGLTLAEQIPGPCGGLMSSGIRLTSRLASMLSAGRIAAI